MNRNAHLSRRRFLHLSAGLSVGAALVSACVAPTATESGGMPSSAASEGETIIAGAAWWLNKQVLLEDLAAEYQEEFPDKPQITLLPETFDLNKIVLEYQQGISSMDCFMGGGGIQYNFPVLNSGAIASIQDVIDASGLEEYLPTPETTDYMWNGEAYLLPTANAGSNMNWRKSILEQAGATAPPEFLEDLVPFLEEIGNSVTASDGSEVFPVSWDPARPWRAHDNVALAMLGSEGYFSDNPEEVIQWDNEGFPIVLNYLKQLLPFSPPEIFSPGDAYGDVFAAGKAAIIWTSETRGPELAQTTFGIDDLGIAAAPMAREPISGDGTIVTIRGTEGAFFFQNGDVQNAFDFLAWCYPQERYQLSLATQGGWTPCAPMAFELEGIPPWVADTARSLERGTRRPDSEFNLTQILQWSPFFEAFLKDEIATAEEAIQQGKEAFAAAVAEAKA